MQTSPQLIEKRIKNFQDGIRQEILDGIKAYVETNGLKVDIKQDSRWGYPCIYDDDAHVTVMGLRSVQVNARGTLCVTSDTKPNMVINKLPITSLLQLWDTAIRQKV